MIPGKIEGQEFEYIRQGTSLSTASRHVITGQIEALLIQLTRTETDFVLHIRNVVAESLCSGHIFVTDQLNTYQSEVLVLYVMEAYNLKLTPEEMG